MNLIRVVFKVSSFLSVRKNCGGSQRLGVVCAAMVRAALRLLVLLARAALRPGTRAASCPTLSTVTPPLVARISRLAFAAIPTLHLRTSMYVMFLMRFMTIMSTVPPPPHLLFPAILFYFILWGIISRPSYSQAAHSHAILDGNAWTSSPPDSGRFHPRCPSQSPAIPCVNIVPQGLRYSSQLPWPPEPHSRLCGPPTAPAAQRATT
jgi:hypothetical protein